MTEQWQELKETIIELRDNDGTGTQQEVCKFLANLMDVLEKQIQEPKTEWIPVSERLPAIETDVLLTSWSGKQQYVGWIDAYGKWQADDGEVIDGYEPIAWCPLPEPYKLSEIPTGSESESSSEKPNK